MKARIEDNVIYSPNPNIEIPVCSFYTLARERLLVHPDKISLVSDGVSLTRAQVLAGMERYAVGFQQHGVLPGDRVCIHVDNEVENLLAMYGCILAGATIVLAKTSLTERELRYQAEDGDCTHIITEEKYTDKVKAAVSNMNMKALVCMGRAAGFVSACEFSKLDEQQFRECPIADPRSTVLAVCYTSGTTGMPKGAEITHYNYVACFYTTRLQMPWGEEDIFFGSQPITHQSGMLYFMVAVLDGASCTLLSANLTPAEILDSVDKYKATAAFFFSSQIKAIVSEMRRTGRRLPRIRAIVMGGSVVSASTADAARESYSGLKLLLNMYGMTESCGIVAGQPKTCALQTNADVGVPATGVRIKRFEMLSDCIPTMFHNKCFHILHIIKSLFNSHIVDVCTRRKLGPHETGEICFQSLSMVRGYYKRPKETAELFDDEGWCRSGDAGFYDEDGKLYILERLKQMIKCMDNQVVPAELEELLLCEHALEIAEISVVGLPHSDYGEAPAAAIVLTEEGRRNDLPALAERIKATVAGNLAVHKHLYGGVYFVDHLPKTETSKINRSALARTLIRA
ncbi:uncharacterized protein [Dermacentor albipictus]|uniref:uncharacterized protein n=1 Tax=Dermacentor albipictus TaxID=60249 RepID=UPI0038FD1531